MYGGGPLGGGIAGGLGGGSALAMTGVGQLEVFSMLSVALFLTGALLLRSASFRNNRAQRS